MLIRRATLDDLAGAQEIYAQARAFMEQVGNPTQWAGGYPQEDMLRDDIVKGNLYVCEEEGQILSPFYFAIEPDDTYQVIEGAWLNDGEYGVVHRIATKRGTRGVGRYCLEWAFDQACKLGASGGLRIDTHQDNVPMRSLLEKLGYQTCGTIYTYDGSPRIAFQKLPQ